MIFNLFYMRKYFLSIFFYIEIYIIYICYKICKNDNKLTLKYKINFIYLLFVIHKQKKCVLMCYNGYILV